MAWFTRLKGEISTAWRLTTPAEPILVASSLGPLFNLYHKIRKKHIIHIERCSMFYCYEIYIKRFVFNGPKLYIYLLMTASTIIWMGLASVNRWMISIACLTMRTAISFLPLFLPCIIRELVNRSTIGHWAFLNLLAWYLPAVWGIYIGCLEAVAVM